MGKAQHPLAHRDGQQDTVHETRRALGHAPAAAARAEAAALAGEAHEPLEGAVPTAEPRKAVRQHAARQEVPELLLHELRQAVAHRRHVPPHPETSPGARVGVYAREQRRREPTRLSAPYDFRGSS
jgi:hypothetical protein